MNDDNGNAKALHTDAFGSDTTLDAAALPAAAMNLQDAMTLPETAATITQIAFIEANVPDLQDLLSGLAPGVTAVVLDPSQDGVQQIADYLASHNTTNLAGIDIVAHGADGAMQLGTATLDSATIAGYRAQLQQIGASLASGGAILLFGCDVAQDASGVSFLDQLSQATGGAAIAAASHLVGDASGGGSFNLDVNTGAVNVGAPFTAAAMAGYHGELQQLSSGRLYIADSDLNVGSDTDTQIQQSAIAASGTAFTGSTDLVDSGADEWYSLQGVAVDPANGTYFFSTLNETGIAEIEAAYPLDNPASAGLEIYTIGASSSIAVNGIALDQANDLLYFAQAGLVNYATAIANETGIFTISETGSAPTQVINDVSTAGGTLVGPTALALDTGTKFGVTNNLVFFTDNDGPFPYAGGVDNIDVGNILSGDWSTLYSFPSSTDGSGNATGGIDSTIAVNPTSAAGGDLYFTAMNPGVVASNYILKASYTLTGSGTNQSAEIGPVTTLYAGADADFPDDIVLNPATDTFYITDYQGGVYAGSMDGGGALTLVGTTAGASHPNGMFFESVPTISVGGTVTYVPGNGPITLNSDALVSNTDGMELVNATVAITDGLSIGDELSCGTLNGMDASYDSGTGVLSLTGTVSADELQGVLDSVTFNTTSSSTAQRTITWSTSDGNVGSADATSVAAFGSDIDLAAGGTVTYTGGGAPVTLDTVAIVTDTNTVTGATVSINTGFVVGDALNFTDMLGITGSYDAASGTLTLGGNANAADYQAALDSITYSFATNGDPTDAGNAPTRTIDWSVSDGSGTSVTQTSTVITQESPILTYGVTIDVPGIVAASETVAAGTLTLLDAGGTALGTIAVGTTFATSDFGLSSDGNGGTEITVDTIFGTYTSELSLLTNPTSIATTGNISDSTGVAIYGGPAANWTLTNSGTVTETGFGPGAVLFISGTVVNTSSGVIDGNDLAGAGVSLVAGGMVTNEAGGTISGHSGVVAANAATVVNAGVITANDFDGNAVGVYLPVGGSLTNQSTGTISGFYGIWVTGTSGTVVNLGTIHSSSQGGAGVYLADGGVVTNGAAGGTVSSAYIDGYQVGVQFGSGGTGTLTNYGTISGNPAGRAVSMASGIIINGPSGATGALIEGGAQANAVLIGGAGTVVNYGTIRGTENLGDSSIYFGVSLGGAGTISNLGPQSLITNYVAVYAAMDATVTNAGTIASLVDGDPGQAAVVFGGGTNRLIIDPGAKFIGTVSGSGPVTLSPGGNTQVIGTQNGVGTTTMELASGASAGTLSGLGVQYVGFAAIEVDTGANWHLDGSNTLASGVTLTDGGTLTVDGTLLNDGVMTGASEGVVLGAGGLLTNQSDGLISGVGGSGAGTLVNAGFIGNPTSGDGVSFAAGGSVTNQSGGMIVGEVGVYIGGGAGDVTNFGTVTGDPANGISVGISFGQGGSVTNQSGGAITGYYGVSVGVGGLATGSNAGLINGVGVGVYMAGGGTFTNQAGGTITGGREAFGGTAATVVNAGYVSASAKGVYLFNSSSLTNQSGGVIDGYRAVFFIGGHGTVVNAGTINGDTVGGTGVSEFDGGAVDNQSGGTITGYDGVSSFNTSTVANSGIIDGQRYGIRQNGGTITNLTGGVISGGVDAIYFTASYTSRLIIQPGAVFDGLVHGGNMIGASAVSTLELASAASAGELSGIGSQYVDFAQVTIDADATWTLNGTQDGFATLTNAGTLENGVTLGNGSFTVSNQSTGTINGGISVEQSVSATTVTNAGSIDGGMSAGVSIASGGNVTNASGGVISGYKGIWIQSDGTLVNRGTVVNYGFIGETFVGVELGSGGSVTNVAGGTISARYDISAFNNSATVVNDGVFVNTAAGIVLGQGGTVTNQSDGTISGNNGIFIYGAGGTVVNAGSIGATGLYAIQLVAGGSVTNQSSGRITGPDGIEAFSVAATVVNAGYISGTTTTGINLASGGTVINQSGGTIEGSVDAIYFGSGNTNRLVVDPGATFIGTVDGGNFVGNAQISTLELGSAASAGTFSGLGSQFINFAQVTIDAGAQWTLSGSNTLVAGASLNNAGTLTDSGTLTNAGTISGNQLNLAGGTLINQATGLISGSYIYGAASGGANSVVNFGTIDGGLEMLGADSVTNATGALITGAWGVRVGMDGTVTNAGTIEGSSVAVSFGGGNARLIDDPGAVFAGGIDGGGGAATFELASGSSSGFVSGFGSNIINFNTLVFDAGSQWTVQDGFNNGLASMAIQGFAFGDTIDMTGFGAISRTFSNNELVLEDGLGNSETLHIQGALSTSNFQIQDVAGTTVITLQQVPDVVAGGAATFSGGGSSVILDAGLAITDANSAVLVSATIDINSGFIAGDMLNFTDTPGITGSYDAADGVLTLTGTDTLADYQAALDSITYSFDPSNGDPTVGGGDTGRGITWVVNDGTSVSDPASSSLTVVHTAPTVTAGASVVFSGGGDPVVLDGSLTITDADSGDMLTGATIALTCGFFSGDVLNFVNQGGITGTYDPATGSLVLSGTADVATYQAALESITYSVSPSNGDPTNGGIDTGRTISWTVADGVTTGTDSSTLTDTHVAPSVTVSGTVAFEEGGSLPVALAPGMTVSDPDSSGILTGATIVIGCFAAGDVLNFSNMGNVTGTYDAMTGTLVLSGVADIATYQSVLQDISFASSSTIAGTRTIDWTVDDGVTSSSSGTSTVNLTRDAPTISGVVAAQATTDEAPISPFSGVVIGDPNIDQTETVTITLSDPSNGTLTNLGGGTFNEGTYIVSGTSLAVTQAVDGLVFTPTAHSVEPGDTVTTTFTMQVTDSNGDSTCDSTTSVVATAVNDAPTITQGSVDSGVPNTGTVSAGTMPFSVVTVTDQDVGHADTVTVTMGAPGDGAFSDLSGGSYDAETGVYTFTGTAAEVNAALAALVFTAVPPAPGSFVATTDFSVVVTGPGGSASDNAISVSTVAQNVPGVGSGATSSTISVSPDGSSFAPPTDGETNEAIVSTPSAGDTYALPTGYQAIYLGGTADATLTDTSVGGAVLVGNSGNDTISASADGDTLTGGGTSNTYIASGTGDIIGVTGTSTVQTSGSLDVVYANENPLTLTDSGTSDSIGLGSGSASLTLTGTNASVFASTGSVDLTDSGIGDAIGASSGTLTATLSGSGTALYGSTGAMSVTVSATASNVAIGQGSGNATIDVAGNDTTVYGGVGTLDVTVESTAGNAVIGAGSGDATITIAGDDATLFGGSGSLVATVSGHNDLIGLSDGAASITLNGTGTVIYGGSGTISVLDQGVGDVIGAGSGSTTITANGQGAIISGGGGMLDVIGGSGSDTIFGGSGTTTVTGGSGSLTMYGNAGGSISFIGGSGSTVYQAQDGTETFDGSAATASLVLNGGIDASGHDSLIGGSGNDLLCVGTGSDTMTGGGGSNEFIFYKTVIAGSAPSDVVTDFNANDQVYLSGYGSSEAANALASAVSSGGSTTLTLSDHTQITFQNVASASALTGHLLTS